MGLSKNDVSQAVILAGGLGTRLRPYTYLLPKPMLPVGTKPIIEHIIEWLKKYSFTEVIISTSYLSKMIQDYLTDGKQLGIKIKYVTTSKPLGTAGQLKASEKKLNESFVCVYGDTILDFDLKKMVRFHISMNATATIALMRYSTELRYGFIETDKEGRVKEWREKPLVTGYINVGCYVMSRDFLRYIPANKVYGMDMAFAQAIKSGEKLFGFKTEGEFIDIGDKKSYIRANKIFSERMGRLP
jgi:mannose-1-phosphate guanylyltransferase